MKGYAKTRNVMKNEHSFQCSMAEFNDNDDLEWVPPSAAERKVMAARRERSDKISKLMGEYLLKGYKMLATSCQTCGTVELQDKQNRIYCVACSEVDSDENSKDNPVLNPDAASHQIAEEQVRDIESQIVEPEIVQQTFRNVQYADPSQFMHRPTTTRSQANTTTTTTTLATTVNESTSVVLAKLQRATQSLASTNDVDITKNLVGLIKECADCIVALRKAAAE